MERGGGWDGRGMGWEKREGKGGEGMGRGAGGEGGERGADVEGPGKWSAPGPALALGGPGSRVRVSASYSTVRHLNAHPQSVGPTLKLLFKFTLFRVLSNVRTVFALW